MSGAALLVLGGALVVGVVLLVLGLVLAARSGALVVGSQRFESPHDLAALVGLALARTAGGLFGARLPGIALVGPLSSGRRAFVRYVRGAEGSSVRLAVQADRTAELSVEPAGVNALAGAPEDVKGALEAAFAHFHCERVVMSRGELVALVPLDKLEPAHYRSLLVILDAIAGAYDRAPIDVDVLGGRRLALARPGTEGARCVGCEQGITGEEQNLVACGSCATVVHSGCWRGACGYSGCDGMRAERAH